MPTSVECDLATQQRAFLNQTLIKLATEFGAAHCHIGNKPTSVEWLFVTHEKALSNQPKLNRQLNLEQLFAMLAINARQLNANLRHKK